MASANQGAIDARVHDIDLAISGSNFKTPAEAKRPNGWVNPKIPDADLADAIRFCAEHGLEYGPTGNDIVLIPISDTKYFPYLRWSGVERVLRRTGVWLPGQTTWATMASTAGNELVANATCNIFSCRSNSWITVGASARWSTYFDRDMTAAWNPADRSKYAPVGEWAMHGWELLAEVAQWKAAKAGLGDILAPYKFLWGESRAEAHAEITADRAKAASSASGSHRIQ